MAEKDQGAKAIIQLRPADIIAFALPGAEYLGPLATDVATEPQLVLDTLYRIRYHGVICAVNIEQAMRRVKATAPADQINPLAFIMAVFTAQAKHDADLAQIIVRRVLNMSFDIFKDSPLYQEIVQEAKQEAAQEAAQAERSKLTRIALEGRFGTLREDIIQALNTADEPTLTALLAHVTTDTLAQVRQRLSLTPQS